jgi:hypothetical protein
MDSVVLNDSTANFDLLGTLDLGGTLATYTFDGRNFILGSTGELSGGTLDIDSGTLVNQGGVLATSVFILGGGATIALGGKALTIGNSSLLEGYIVGNNSAGSVLDLAGSAAATDVSPEPGATGAFRRAGADRWIWASVVWTGSSHLHAPGFH